MPQNPAVEDSDLKQWFAEIKAEGGLPDDQLAQLETILGTDKAKTFLKRSVSNHKDWTRKTMEAAELRKQITGILDTTSAPVVTFDNLNGEIGRASCRERV